ncbi:MAG: SpoIIE family protein phosphatase [Bacteroidales bacterium]|nr:SpoIIE family protein phosphatase [Bacteroidales bacterium]
MNNLFNKILGNPNNYELKHRVANAVILIGIFLGIQSSIFNYILGLPLITVTATIGTSLMLIISYWLSRAKGLFELAVYISLFVSLAIYTPVMWIGNGGSSGGFQYYIFVYLTFAIAVINRKAVIISVISFVIILSTLLLLYEYKFPEEIFKYPSPEDRLLDLIISFVSVLIGVSALFYVYTNQYKKSILELNEKNSELEKQGQILEFQNEHINEGISYAHKIQKAVLPSIEIIKKYSKDQFIIYLPKEKISGDFYYFIKKEDLLVIAVADSTGHGVPGGFMSMLGITMLEEVINREDTKNAAEVLNAFRNKIIISLDQKNTKSVTNDGFDITLCVINTKTKQLNYAGANLPLTVIRNNNEMQIYNPDNMPVGIFISMPPFKNQYIDLQEGDTIYLFTDGIIDQFGGKRNKKFTFNRLQELLIKNADQPLSVQKERIKKAFRTWRGKHKKTDDVLIIGLKVF